MVVKNITVYYKYFFKNVYTHTHIYIYIFIYLKCKCKYESGMVGGMNGERLRVTVWGMITRAAASRSASS